MSGREIKVLHLIAGDLTGGAARGAYWLHLGLLSHGVHSRILTDSQLDLGDDTVTSVSKNKKGKVLRTLRRAIDLAPAFFYRGRKKVIFSTGFAGFDFTKTSAYTEADIVHLHWINDGFISIRHLRKVNKPIVWTLRDMWPMTGGCHVAAAWGCNGYVVACGQCPQLASRSKYDLSRIILALKKRYVPQSIQVVGISNWISGCAKESALFKSHDIRTIFNNLDTQVFHPENKSVARAVLGIDTEKKVILLGAQNLGDFYKGFNNAIESLRYLDNKKYHLCFFGDVKGSLIGDTGFDTTSLGFLHDTISLRIAYSAADVFVSPSIMDTFGKTIAEAMACGTPVVCFDATGPKDIVDHKINGYRAVPFDPMDLARGVEWVTTSNNYESLAENARKKVVTTFDSVLVAQQYVDLYRRMIEQSRPQK